MRRKLIIPGIFFLRIFSDPVVNLLGQRCGLGRIFRGEKTRSLPISSAADHRRDLRTTQRFLVHDEKELDMEKRRPHAFRVLQ